VTDTHIATSTTNTDPGSVHQVVIDTLPKATMTFSEEGKDLLKRIERLHLTPYDDQTGRDTGHYVPGATIGYGHLISSADWDVYANGITQAQADALFDSDMQPTVDTVNDALTAGVTQNQFDALVILCFNIGPGAFRSSSALRLINDPQATTAYNSVDDAWRAFNRSQGQVNNGVINRRNAELRIYSHGDYSGW